MFHSDRGIEYAAFDDRNQLDMLASMPGGLAGVEKMIADFHRRGDPRASR